MGLVFELHCCCFSVDWFIATNDKFTSGSHDSPIWFKDVQWSDGTRQIKQACAPKRDPRQEGKRRGPHDLP